MKKYLVLGIVFLMLFTLAACDKDTNTTPDSDTQTQAQEPSDNTGRVGIEGMKKAVAAGIITAEEYLKITGVPYK